MQWKCEGELTCCHATLRCTVHEQLTLILTLTLQVLVRKLVLGQMARVSSDEASVQVTAECCWHLPSCGTRTQQPLRVPRLQPSMGQAILSPSTTLSQTRNARPHLMHHPTHTVLAPLPLPAAAPVKTAEASLESAEKQA